MSKNLFDVILCFEIRKKMKPINRQTNDSSYINLTTNLTSTIILFNKHAKRAKKRANNEKETFNKKDSPFTKATMILSLKGEIRRKKRNLSEHLGACDRNSSFG